VIFSIREIVFAPISGIFEIKIPYITHNIIPNTNIINIGREMSFVCFVLIALIACGRKANVVSDAPANPMINIIVSVV